MLRNCRKCCSEGRHWKPRSQIVRRLSRAVITFSPAGTDSAQHVVQVHPSSREEALADRRLVLTVDADGIVTEVEDGPGWLFGFSPAQLLGRSLADCVATLRPTGTGADGAQEEEEDVSDLLGMLVTK